MDDLLTGFEGFQFHDDCLFLPNVVPGSGYQF